MAIIKRMKLSNSVERRLAAQRMTDICKCASNGCPQADTCWRKLAPTAIMQRYADYKEGYDLRGECLAYWPVEGKNNESAKS
jgi:hypothetical protein